MKTNKVTILTVATLATLALANNAKADAQDSPVSSQEAPTALVTNPEGNNTTEAKQPTEITKEGTEITVKNPEVVVDQSNGTGKYQPFSVEYENNTVTTVFNNYFASHPLNKQMSLKLDATWTDKVQPGKPVSVNFNGTVVTTQIGKEQVIGKDELLSKWGSQDKDDPTVINWTARVNYAKRVLNYVKIIDEMSENQKLVDNFFEVKNIESVDPWIDKGDAMNLVKSISKSEHGFTITMDRLDHMIYINYKTKLTKPVKESFNPTNKIEIKAESDGSTSYSYVQLVGGKGDASGENKPTFEIPNDAPKYEKPEWHGGIPGIPEERVKPEYTEPIGTIPNDAPILEKPYLPIEDIPLMPPAPILEKPELHVPEEPVKPHEDPKTPPVTPEDKPKVPSESPKVEPKKEEVKVENKGEVSHETPVETYKAPMLPQTGSQAGVALSVLGMTVLSLTVAFKKKEN